MAEQPFVRVHRDENDLYDQIEQLEQQVRDAREVSRLTLPLVKGYLESLSASPYFPATITVKEDAP